MGMCGTVRDKAELNLTLCVSEHCWLRCEYLQWVYVYSDEDQKGRAGLGINHLGCYLARCALPAARLTDRSRERIGLRASIARFKGGPVQRLWRLQFVSSIDKKLFSAPFHLFCGTQGCRISSRSAPWCGRVGLRPSLAHAIAARPSPFPWSPMGIDAPCNYRRRPYLRS